MESITWVKVLAFAISDGTPWIQIGEAPDTTWVFGQTDEGEWVAANNRSTWNHDRNIKVMDSEADLRRLIAWFMTHGWVKTTVDDVFSWKNYGQFLSRFGDNFKRVYPPSQVVVELVGEDSVFRIWYDYSDKDLGYGRKGPKYRCGRDLMYYIQPKLDAGFNLTINRLSEIEVQPDGTVALVPASQASASA